MTDKHKPDSLDQSQTSHQPQPKLSKSQQSWNRILGELPGLQSQQPGSATAEAVNPEEAEFSKLLADLPGLQLPELTPPAFEDEVVAQADQHPPRFCLCEMPDGEYPNVRIFKGVEGLVTYLGKLEGDDMAVWAFYGIPLRFTVPDKGGHRYLFLPGEQEAIPIPRTDMEPIQKIAADLLELDFQADGWIGDPVMAEASSPDYYRTDDEESREKSKKRKKKKKGPRSVADEDESEPT